VNDTERRLIIASSFATLPGERAGSGPFSIMSRLFPVEFVFPGHPDKLCDAIACTLVLEAHRREAEFRELSDDQAVCVSYAHNIPQANHLPVEHSLAGHDVSSVTIWHACSAGANHVDLRPRS